MLLADWLFQRTKAVLLRCLFLFLFFFSVLPLCHFKGFEIRAPCRASKFCGSAVLSRWMWSAGVTLSFRPLRYFWRAKVPRVPTQWRGRRIRRRALPVVLFPTFFPSFSNGLIKCRASPPQIRFKLTRSAPRDGENKRSGDSLITASLAATCENFTTPH